jgi:hypothetical protein
MSFSSTALNGFPVRMLGRQRADTVKDKLSLETYRRLFGPERPVVVEDGDSLGYRHEVRTALGRYRWTKLSMDCFAAPSFQEASGVLDWLCQSFVAAVPKFPSW